MSENQPPPYGGAPGGQPDPYGQNPYAQPPGIPSYPGGGQQDVSAYGQQAPTGMPPLAHWGWRVASALIDAIPFIIVNLIVQSAMKGTAGSGVAVVVDLAITFVYAWLEGTRGQTPGKMAVGTRTLREADGQLLGFGLALGRRLLHILDALPCLLGYLWPLWDQKKQCFADKLVHSVVIKP